MEGIPPFSNLVLPALEQLLRELPVS